MTVPVQAPPATPPTYGLVRSAREVTEPDERWVLGLSWDPEACGPSGTADPCLRVARAVDNDRPGFVDYFPFIVWASDVCSTMGQRDGAARARVTRRLIACESKQIEAELWSGAQTVLSNHDNPRLASTASDEVLGGTARHPVDALGALEDGLADCSCGGVGMIHATPGTVTAWAAHNLLERPASGQLMTKLGTLVVAGQGYDGSAPAADGATPAAPAAGTAWAYATLRVDLRRGAIAVTGAEGAEFDRAVNTIELRAERAAAASFDPCCHLAALVDITA